MTMSLQNEFIHQSSKENSQNDEIKVNVVKLFIALTIHVTIVSKTFVLPPPQAL